jgi:hypothetical protein
MGVALSPPAVAGRARAAGLARGGCSVLLPACSWPPKSASAYTVSPSSTTSITDTRWDTCVSGGVIRLWLGTRALWGDAHGTAYGSVAPPPTHARTQALTHTFTPPLEGDANSRRQPAAALCQHPSAGASARTRRGGGVVVHPPRSPKSRRPRSEYISAMFTCAPWVALTPSRPARLRKARRGGAVTTHTPSQAPREVVLGPAPHQAPTTRGGGGRRCAPGTPAVRVRVVWHKAHSPPRPTPLASGHHAKVQQRGCSWVSVCVSACASACVSACVSAWVQRGGGARFGLDAPREQAPPPHLCCYTSPRSAWCGRCLPTQTAGQGTAAPTQAAGRSTGPKAQPTYRPTSTARAATW